GEIVEKSSTIVIVVISLIALLLAYGGVVKSIGASLNLSEGVSWFLFAIALNLGLVFYQIGKGKVINKICKRPYI
ncbi:hypothetical protein MNBD_NITROSPINAE04-2588, partial [hydrothermal vent metagenome]